MTMDELASTSGLPKGAVHNALKGESALTVEAFVTLCRALGLAPAALLDAAVAHQSATLAPASPLRSRSAVPPPE